MSETTTRKFVEDAILDGTRKTKDGYLIAAVKCARTGIQYYTGDELGRPELDVVPVYRPEAEVFDKDSLASYVGKPCTDNHPSVAVDSENWKELSIGSIHEGVLREGEYVRIPITLMDAETVEKVEAGKREISMGYTMSLDWTPGTTPGGESFEAVQRNIRINHLAIVDKGRAGSECRVGDGDTWATAPSPNNNNLPTKDTMSDTLQEVTVDGLPIKTTGQGAAAIAKLQKDNDSLQAKVDAADTDHAKAIAEKDKELAAKDAEIDKLKKAQVDDAELDRRAEARASLISDASRLAKDADFKGMTDADIRKEAVKAVYGEDAVKDKSEAYIEARFDVALDSAKDSSQGGDNNFRQAVQTRDHSANDSDNGQDAYEKRLSDGWKTQPAGNAA